MKRYIALFCIIMAALASLGADIQFLHLGANLRLSSKLVNDIYQDDTGFLYFGTAAGLDRYDGYNVTRFFCDPADSTTIGDSYVSTIQEMPDGRLWIDNNNGVFSIFDLSLARFTRVDSAMCSRIGVPAVPLLAHFDTEGREWYCVENDGLYLRTDGITKKISDPDGLMRDGRVCDIVDGLPRRVYVCITGGTLALVDTNTARVLSSLRAERADEGTPDNVYQAFIDRDGMLWLYSDLGLQLYSTTTGKWHDNIGGTPLPPGQVKVVRQDSSGRIWIGLEHDGVVVVGNNADAAHLTHSPSDSRSLVADNVTTIFEDRSGTMWVGSRKNGVSFHNPDAFKFDFTSFPDVNCILGGEKGEVWLATDSEGVILWNTTDKTSRAIRLPGASGPDQTMVTLARDGLGRVWAGSYAKGLTMISPDGKSVRRYTMADGLSSNNIWSIIPRPDGTLLLGTLGAGVQLYNPRTGSSKIWNNTNSGLVNDFIISMSEGTDGRVWMGTAYGLAVYDPTTDKIETLFGTRSGPERLLNLNINQVVADSRGLIWIATRSGLNVYDPATDRLYVVPTGEGDSVVLGLAEDLAHAMWVSIGGSLMRVTMNGDPGAEAAPTFSTNTYDSSDGLQDCDFNQRSIAMLADGRMMIGGYYGVNSWRPEVIRNDDTAPKVFFTSLSLFNEEVHPGSSRDGRVLLPRRLSDMDGIELRHSDNEFTIGFSTDGYVNPGKTEYHYRLDGFNEEWQHLPAGSHSVTYTNLAPGRYRLHVRAVSADGTSGLNEAELDITVKPPFYASAPARALYILLAVLAVVAATWLLHKREVRMSQRRIRREADRKQQELDQLKFRFFTNVSHELRTPLTLITSPLESMLKEPLDARLRDKLEIVHSNADKLLDMVNQLLDFRKNEMAGHTLNLSRGNIVEFVRSVSEGFRPLCEKKGLTLSFESETRDIDMNFDADKMGKIVSNLLSNAVKFTPDGGSIDVSVATLPGSGMLEISVADTGCGIPDADKPHVFERFFQATEGPAMGGTGIGLSLVAEFTRLHGGTTTVRDNVERGTVFTVSLPLTQPDSDKAGSEIQSKLPDQINVPDRVRLLVVDDNPDLLHFINTELSDKYTVSTALNGEQALERVQRSKPDIIITDIMMDGMDGIELCRHIKSAPETADIPLLILTAKHDVSDKIEGLTLGADDYMTKPFNIDELRVRLQKLLELRGKGARRALIEPEPAHIAITSLDERLIERAVRYVDENMKRTGLSVEELAAELGMSRVHLYKRLKQITGKTPIEFIRVLRLKRAAQMLRESQLNISEIAFNCGFNNPKYFSRYFKEEFGVLPSVYQELTNPPLSENISTPPTR